MCFPPLLLLSCLCFQRNRGVFESAGEGCSTQTWNNWGDITGDVSVSGCCVRIVSLPFREAAVGRREGEAWHWASSDFMGDGRRKGRQECAAGAWTPPTGSSSLPGRMPGLDPGGSLMDDQEHHSGSRTARLGCYDFLCSPLAGVSWRVWTSACV